MPKVRWIIEAEYGPINDNGNATTLPPLSDIQDALGENIAAEVDLRLVASVPLGESESDKEWAKAYHNENCSEDGCGASSELREAYPCTQYKGDAEEEDGLSSYG